MSVYRFAFDRSYRLAALPFGVTPRTAYVEGDLAYAYDMAAMGQELQPHLWAKLQRQ